VLGHSAQSDANLKGELTVPVATRPLDCGQAFIGRAAAFLLRQQPKVLHSMPTLHGCACMYPGWGPAICGRHKDTTLWLRARRVYNYGQSGSPVVTGATPGLRSGTLVPESPGVSNGNCVGTAMAHAHSPLLVQLFHDCRMWPEWPMQNKHNLPGVFSSNIRTCPA
jgi:hypothetical protein